MAPSILIVDDDPMSRDIIRVICERLGYAVDVAEDGFAGLTRLRDGRYRAALVDYHLPEMDGYALARLMHDLDGDLRLIGVTADRHGLSARCVSNALFEAIVAKPVSPEALAGVLAAVVPTRKETSPGARLRKPDTQRAREMAELLWRKHGLGGLPRVVALPEPDETAAAALRHCFDLVETDEPADLILVTHEDGLPKLGEIRMFGTNFLSPAVQLFDGAADACETNFQVNDPSSWAAVARLAARRSLASV